LKATTEVESRRLALFLLLPAFVCLARVALPQEYANPQNMQPIVVGAKKANHLVLSQATPDYPVLAKVNYIQGRVRLEVEVKSDGKIGRVHVLTGNPILAASALKAVRDWIYRPLVAPTGPTGFLTEVVFNFSLHVKTLMLQPSQAERDLARQVKPPEVSGRPEEMASNSVVHMRLLLNDLGEVIDSGPSPDAAGDVGTAQRTVQSWRFRPAHWGSLPIPWYIEVDVPIHAPPIPLAPHASLVSR
jgi:TonB family protein